MAKKRNHFRGVDIGDLVKQFGNFSGLCKGLIKETDSEKERILMAICTQLQDMAQQVRKLVKPESVLGYGVPRNKKEMCVLIDELLKQRRKIQAIKLVYDNTDHRLRESKAIIDGWPDTMGKL